MINEKCVKKYCCEDISQIENYDLAVNDKTQMWHCHHIAEILPCGRFTMNDLKKFNLYYDRPANELIFLTPAEHHKLHYKTDETKQKMSESHKGKPCSEETRKKISESLKGHIPWNKGKRGLQVSCNKGKTLSEEHKRKLSESRKGKKRGPYKKKNQGN